MKKTITMLLICLLSVLMLTSCQQTENNQQNGNSDPQQNVSADNADNAENAADTSVFGTFTAKDLDGNEVTQDIFASNKLTMVNIWATFCGPCINEMPDLGELAAEYADKGVGIVGIPLDVTDEKGNIDSYLYNEAVDIVATTKAAYTHIVPVESMFVRKLASVTAVPETIFVDSQGNQVGDCYYGARSKAQWTEIIEELLGEVQ